eukprot:2975128-Prymnesium_polylepis.1
MVAGIRRKVERGSCRVPDADPSASAESPRKEDGHIHVYGVPPRRRHGVDGRERATCADYGFTAVCDRRVGGSTPFSVFKDSLLPCPSARPGRAVGAGAGAGCVLAGVH